MKKNQNLKWVIAAEVAVLFCLCCAAAGILIYTGAPQLLAGLENPSGATAPAPLSADFLTAQAAATQAAAATPTRVVKGSRLENQPDGTTRFSDLDGEYEISFPSGWLVLRPGNEAEVNAALSVDGAQNPMLVERLTTDRAGYQADFDRLLAYPVRADLQPNVIFGFSKVAYDGDDRAPIDNDSMGGWVRNLEASNAMPGFRVTAAAIVKNGNGIDFMQVKGRYSLNNNQGTPVPFSVMVLFFKPNPGGLTRLTITILQDYQEQINPDLEAIRESIRLPGE